MLNAGLPEPAESTMPPGLLPYYLALAPSPSDARLAFAVARPMTADEDPGVSV